MPLPGGPADKAGNSYERRWTVFALINLLAGKAQSLRIEVPGDEGVGSEFRQTVNGVAEWHQAKRQRAAGPWTLNALVAEGVLPPWQTKLDRGDRCVFIASTGADELRELAERARSALSWEEFDREFLAARSVRATFERLTRAWPNLSAEKVYDALQRITVHSIGEAELADWINERLRALVPDREAAAVAAVLAQLADDAVHRELTVADVRTHLAAHGAAPRDVSGKVDERHTGNDPLTGVQLHFAFSALPTVDPHGVLADIRIRLATAPVVWLWGPSGIGKSRFAAAFASQRASSYAFVRWLDCTNDDALTAAVARIAAEVLPTAPPTLETLVDVLRTEPRRGLLVVDNVNPATRDLISFLAGELGPHHLIGTSQHWSPGALTVRPLDTSGPVLKWLQQISRLNEREAIDLIGMVGGLPLALIAAALAPSSPASEADRDAIILGADVGPQERARSAIQRNLSRFGQTVRQGDELLAVLATMSPGQIPLGVLQSLAGMSITDRDLEDLGLWLGSGTSQSGVFLHEFVRDTIREVLTPEQLRNGRRRLEQTLSADEVTGVSPFELLPHALELRAAIPLLNIAVAFQTLGHSAAALWCASLSLAELASFPPLAGAHVRATLAEVYRRGGKERMAGDIAMAGLRDLYASNYLDLEHTLLSNLQSDELEVRADERAGADAVACDLLHTVGHAHASELGQENLRLALSAFTVAYIRHKSLHPSTPCGDTRMLARDILNTSMALASAALLDTALKELDGRALPERAKPVWETVEELLNYLGNLPLHNEALGNAISDTQNWMDKLVALPRESFVRDGVLDEDVFRLALAPSVATAGGSARNVLQPRESEPFVAALSDLYTYASVARESADEAAVAEVTTAIRETVEAMETENQAVSATVKSVLIVEAASRAIGAISQLIRQLEADNNGLGGAPNDLADAATDLGRAVANVAEKAGLELSGDFVVAVALASRVSGRQAVAAEICQQWTTGFRTLQEVHKLAAVTMLLLPEGSGGEEDNTRAEQWERRFPEHTLVSRWLRYLDLLLHCHASVGSGSTASVPERSAVKSTLRLLPPSPGSDVFARLLLHTFGHMRGWSSGDGLWAHRCCVAISLSRGCGAYDLALELHCLGHCYDAHGRSGAAKESYRKSYEILHNLYGSDGHYLIRELEDHLALIPDHDVRRGPVEPA